MILAGLLFAAALSDAQASALVAGCAAHAAGKGQSHAIAVVDAGGHLVAFKRMDGNTTGIGAFAIRKAQSSAAWRSKTSGLAEGAAATPGFASAPDVVTVAGGVPVYAKDGEFLGAIGTSGEAPADDESCALAAIAAAGLASERKR